jgi:hypothetical protein
MPVLGKYVPLGFPSPWYTVLRSHFDGKGGREMVRKRHNWTARVKLDMHVGYDSDPGCTPLYDKTLQELMAMIDAKGRANTKGIYDVGVENTAEADRIHREAWQERLATAKKKGREKVRVSVPVTVEVHTYFMAELRPRDLRNAPGMAREWALGKYAIPRSQGGVWTSTDRPFILPV